ncbi:MAG: hypothetical protein IT557_09260 [Alphaproteobacteria bacterium]|nr:hypothetical protein [Alphaproteobacteria bacterium]
MRLASRHLAGLAAAAFITGMAGEAGAVALSQRYDPIPAGLSHDQCKERGTQAMVASGLKSLGQGRDAVFGETDGGEYIVSVFCLTQQGVIVISAAGPSSDRTVPIADGVADQWNGRAGGARPAPVARPAPPARAPAPAPSGGKDPAGRMSAPGGK